MIFFVFVVKSNYTSLLDITSGILRNNFATYCFWYLCVIIKSDLILKNVRHLQVLTLCVIL